MAIKKRINTISNKKAIEELADELADKPYGEDKKMDTIVRVTISLPSSMLYAIEDLAKYNKRKKGELRSVSAIVRNCLEQNLKLND